MRNPVHTLLRPATSLRVGLAATGIALLKTSGRTQLHTCVVADRALAPAQSNTPQALIGELRRVLTETKCANFPATVVISDQSARLFMVVPPQNATSLRDCHAAAAMRFHALYGEPMNDWHVQADWHARHPFLACAVPNALIAGLHQAAKECRLTLLTVVPQFIAAWNRWHHSLDSTAWFGIVQDSVLTLAAIHEKKLSAIVSTPVPSGAWQDAQWLPAIVAREALRLNLPPPGMLKLSGSVSGQAAGKTQVSPLAVWLDAAQPRPEQVVSTAVCLARTGMHP